MSTYTTSNRLELQSVGSNINTWGSDHLNAVLSQIDSSLDGVTAISTTGGTVTLTANNGAADQSRERILELSGVLASAATIVVPNVTKWYWVINRCTGGYAVSIEASGGSSLVVPASAATAVWCDGSGNVSFLLQMSSVLETEVSVSTNYLVSAGQMGSMFLASAALTLTLPSAVAAGPGWYATMKNTTSGMGAANVTLASTAGTIDGGTTVTVAALGSTRFTSDGTNWQLTENIGTTVNL
jgi:hypothetical protein